MALYKLASIWLIVEADLWQSNLIRVAIWQELNLAEENFLPILVLLS
ncbi:hypothetical protein [Nostoc sp. TCL240-02]|nr:hypothetical protein [Nostoc sp. TCL240-02]